VVRAVIKSSECIVAAVNACCEIAVDRLFVIVTGAGDLYDMTIHRLDFAIDLLGPISRVSGALARFADRDVTPDGETCAPSDVDDWSCLIGQFQSGAIGVWEGTVVGKGYHHGGVGHEWAEVMGSEGVGVYRLHDPNHILLGKHQETMQPVPVPDEFLKPAEIGITLLDSYLMTPLKSISGVLLTGKKEIHIIKDDYPFCSQCKTHSCQQRIRTLFPELGVEDTTGG